MAKVVFYKINQAQMGDLPKKEGQLILTTDTKKLFLDNDASTRLEIGSYNLEQNPLDGHKLTFTNPDGSEIEIIIPDNDTTYTAGTGITLSGTEFSNSGVRNITTGSTNGTISVNINGTVSDVAIAGLKDLAYKSSISTEDISSGVLPVNKGGIGVNNLTSGQVLVGNGISGVTTKAIDNTSGGTSGSDSLITSGAVKSGLDSKLNTALKGAPNGLAELDGEGKVPSSQLPSYVDDVLEFANKNSFPQTGESGKIYVAIDTNLSYRWGGSTYVEIASSLALGETSSTAFRGDYGAAAYKHGVTNKGNAFSEGFYKITTNGEGHVTNTVEVQKSDITNLGIEQFQVSTTEPVDESVTVWINPEGDPLVIPTKTSELTNDSGFITNIPEEYKTKTENDEYYQPIGNYPTKEEIDKQGFLGIGALKFEEPTEMFSPYNYWIFSGECGDFSEVISNNEPLEIIWDGTSYIMEYNPNFMEWGNLEEYPCYLSLASERIYTNDSSKYHKVIVKDIRGKVIIGKLLSSNYIDLPTIPTKTSDLTNDSGFITKNYVDTSIQTAIDNVWGSDL